MIDPLVHRPWNPTPDLDPCMRAMGRYIARHGLRGDPDGPGLCLSQDQMRAPEWQALIRRLDLATGRAVVGEQLGLFDAPT